MYYRISQNNLKIEDLETKLTGYLSNDYNVYFKKGSKYKWLQFVGRKDCIIIKKNALHGYKLYVINASEFCDISIEGYIPSRFLRDAPIPPWGLSSILINFFYRINQEEFYTDLMNALNENYKGELRQ